MILLNAHEESPLFSIVQDLLWRPWMPKGTAIEVLVPPIKYLMKHGFIEIVLEVDPDHATVLDQKNAIITLQEDGIWQIKEENLFPFYKLELTDFGFAEWAKNLPTLGISDSEKQHLMFFEKP